jgi:tRNA pseudouridine55 synthase
MDGVIICDKPAGVTSAAVVRQIKARLGKHARVGHLGTLDPFATGVLPILVGEGTKLAPFLQEGLKQYVGVITLGCETDTLDLTGQIIRSAPVPEIRQEQLTEVACRFTGIIQQTPPIFSAIKRQGMPLYKLARRNIDIELPAPRQVEISRLEICPADEWNIRFTVACASGTYIRSLARDIGIALNSAAHLKELRRTASGSFSLAQARPLTPILVALEQGDNSGLIGISAALANLPEVAVDPIVERRLRNGDSSALQHLAPKDAEFFKLTSCGGLVAVARRTSAVTAAIARVFCETHPD